MRGRTFSIDLWESEVVCVSPGGLSNNTDPLPSYQYWTDRLCPESDGGYYAEAGGIFSGVGEAASEPQWDDNRTKCNPVRVRAEFALKIRQHAKGRRLPYMLVRVLL